MSIIVQCELSVFNKGHIMGHHNVIACIQTFTWQNGYIQFKGMQS